MVLKNYEVLVEINIIGPDHPMALTTSSIEQEIRSYFIC